MGDRATKKKMKQQKTGYGIISLSVVAALFLVVALKPVVFPGGAGGLVAVAVNGGGDTTSSLLRTSDVSTSTSKVMAQEDEDTFNIVSNMDGSSKSTQKPNKRKGATLEVFSLLRTSDVSTSTSKVMAQEDFYQKETKYYPLY